MRRRFLAILLLAGILGLPSLTIAQAPGAAAVSGDNAAIKYWIAFGLLPNLDKDLEKRLEQWNKGPIDASALKLIDLSRSSLEYLHRGSKLPRCDWGLDDDDGLFLAVPHLSRSRTLARLAALRARNEFEQGHWGKGIEDVVALLRLSRHVETDSIMVAQLAGYMIETTAIEAAVPYLIASKPVVCEAISAALESLPARPTVQQVILNEKQVVSKWLIRRLKEDERQKKGSWKEVWNVFPVPPVTTVEQAIEMVEEMLPFFDQLAALAAKPWSQFNTQDVNFPKEVKAANPLAGSLIPPMITLVEAERRIQTKMALFKAAIAIVDRGPDQLKDFKDPAVNGPFEFRALNNGFELKSKLLHIGRPLTLTVGSEQK